MQRIARPAAALAEHAKDAGPPDSGPPRPAGGFGDAMLLRWRNHALDQAQRALAEAIGRQDAAQQTLEAAARDIIDKRELATSSEDDAAVDDYAAWLPTGRRVVHDAAARLRREALATAAARAALKLARATDAG